jgi:hypothetical protein
MGVARRSGCDRLQQGWKVTGNDEPRTVSPENRGPAYTFCMSDTTIRVDSAVRDKLRALAEEDRTTLGDLLERLAEREQYQREMRRANELMQRLEHAEPDAWREYLDELNTFEQGAAVDGLGDAATEWPEFNEEAKPEAGNSR